MPDSSGIPDAMPAPQPHHSVAGRIRNYFLTGLIVAGPIAITFYLTWWFVTWVDGLVRPFVPIAYRPETYLPVKIPGFGLIIAFLALTLLGFLTANLVGRTLVEIGESLPRTHADRAADLSRPEAGVRDAVLEVRLDLPHRRAGRVSGARHVVAGVPLDAARRRYHGAAAEPGEEYVSAFMPCTPNPTTGFFFYVLRRDIIELDISVEAAMTLLMSAGMVQPDNDAQKKLAALSSHGAGGEVAGDREIARRVRISRLSVDRRPC